jgi:di/tricarboxylate transporter|tara:strand:- start:2196 stop:4061 length:1866 start_codon:yes stop_codon:yes gene_type:complete
VYVIKGAILEIINPDYHGIAVLLLTGVALILFTRDKIPLESTSFVVLLLLIGGFQIFPYPINGDSFGRLDFFAGFGNEALITICSLMIIGQAIERTGALQPLASLISKAWASWPVLALLLTMITASILSAFMNNTPIIVLLMPILVGVSLRTKFPVSNVMMPMGFAAIIGGMSTTIGTSTNLLVVGLARDTGIRDFSMFDFMLPVAIVGGFGILFLWLIAPKLLPERTPPMADTSPRIFNSQLLINEEGFAAGQQLSEILAKTNGEIRIEKIQRNDNLVLSPFPSVVILAGDRLFVKDTSENLKYFEESLGATLYSLSDPDHPVDDETPIKEEGQQLAEVVVTRGSPLHYQSLDGVNFGNKYGLIALAIHRARTSDPETRGNLNTVKLRAGDVILVQGGKEAVEALRDSGKMLVLDGAKDLPQTHKSKRALTVLSVVILSAALGFVPISVSALIGVGFLLLLGCINWQDAANALSTKIIMIIVASLALGKALVVTNMASYLAVSFATVVGGLPIPVILSLFMLLMSIMTNIVSNNAAAVIGTPIAIGIAQQLQVDPEPFILAVLFGANMSYATPFGYQSNLLILSAGGYKFSDFLKIGIPLIFIMWVGFSLVLPTIYGLWT